MSDGDGFKPPGRLRMIADWLFDWFLLPVLEALHLMPGEDDAGKEKQEQPPAV